MRRGQTARLFDSCSNMGDLLTWFLLFLGTLEVKVSSQELKQRLSCVRR
jgi:farnesyl-diphosphate farnesyltransferase